MKQMTGQANADFYPRSPCGERLSDSALVRLKEMDFYPRSPCGERPDVSVVEYKKAKISIHALLAESDLIWRYLTPKALKFLSTLSLRRATYRAPPYIYGTSHFYPRSPCGERLVAKRTTDIRPEFLSTLSLRRATQFKPPVKPHRQISIHALLAESDSTV